MGSGDLIRARGVASAAGARWCAAALVCAATLVLAPGTAAAQETVTASSKAAIVTPLSLVKIDDLDFGSIIAGTTAGTVTIDQNNCTRSSSGGATPVGALYQCAQFAGQAQLGFFVGANLDPSVTLSGSAGGTMTATLALRGPNPRWFVGNSVQLFYVGGTLSVGANQKPGTYTGTFNLQVTYF